MGNNQSECVFVNQLLIIKQIFDHVVEIFQIYFMAAYIYLFIYGKLLLQNIIPNFIPY